MRRLAVITVICMLLVAVVPVSAADRPAGRTVVVSSAADAGAGTLREALDDQRPNDTITFDPTVFPADREVKIAVKSELPHIQAGNVTIDGSDSWVVLDGRDASGGWPTGLMVVSDDNTIRGLEVSRFPGVGIAVSAATGNTIGGDRAVGSGPFGQGNLVTRNYAGIGLWSDGVVGATGNVVTGNLIGADESGRKGQGNGVGVMIVEGAHHNTIGPDNIITRNWYAGARLDDLGTVGNELTRNSIHDNGGPGIAMHRSAHQGVVAPTILSFDLESGTLTGATCPGCTVEVYSSKDDEGSAYEGSAIADEHGRFVMDHGAPLDGPRVTATTTDPQRGTSEFSVPATGTVGARAMQLGNAQLVTQLQPKSSAELDDNRLGAQFDSIAVGDTYDYEIYPWGVKRARIAITGMEPELVDWDRSEFVIDPGHDAVIDRLVANDVAITYVLMFWDKETWPGGEGAPCSRFRTKGEIERYLDFVRFTVGHFKDRVDEWEIWNEPDIKGYCPKHIRVNDYVRLVKRAAPVIRAEDAGAKIVVGGVSGTFYPDSRKWLYALLESEVMPLVDVITWHPMYSESPAVKRARDYYRQYPSMAARIKRRAEANGFRGEYRADEVGWATPWSMGGGHHRAYELTVAAKYFGRGILLHLGLDIGVGVGGNDRVIRNLATLMAGAEPSDVDVRIRTRAKDVVHHAFSTSDGGTMVALWTDGVATTEDPGRKATIRIEGVDGDVVSGLDVLHGYEQPIEADVTDGGLVVRDLLIKDYPLIIKVQPGPILETPAAVVDDAPEVVFHNGSILTMSPAGTVEAVAVTAGRINAVGPSDDLLAAAGPGTEVIDLQGRTLMPGFVDGHSHFFSSDWRGDLEGGQRHLLSIGITTTAELTEDAGLMHELRALDESARLRTRISLYPTPVNVCGDVLGDWYRHDFPVSREPGAMLQVPGVKFFNDGGACNRPAVSFEHADGSRGDLYFQADDLAQMVIEVQEHGYQAIIHGLGDRAVEANLDAIEKAKAVCPADDDHGCRHRIEHNGMVREDMLARYSEVDPVAMIFGGFPACFFSGTSGDYRFVTPDECRPWEWRWRSLIDTNPDVHFAWHSDTPPMGDPKTMRHVHGFVTRREIRPDGTVCEPPDWAIDDLLTVEEALRLMTVEGAYAILREDELGSLEPGKLADLIILSDDPMDVAPDDILGIEVLMTMVGGTAQHCTGDYESLCG